MTVAYIGLGANLDDPAAQLERAFDELERLPGTRVTGRSALYRSPPMVPPEGAIEQPDYLNAVARVETELEARALLAGLLEVERAHGRSRTEKRRWGPRTLDLDLLLYGDARIDEPGLSVPHPGLHERNFVLYPLADLDPGLVVPGRGPLADLLDNVAEQPIERISD